MSAKKNPISNLVDGGARVTFATGALREPSTGKGRYDLIPTSPLRRLAIHYENGALKYARNLLLSNQGAIGWLISYVPNASEMLLFTRGDFVAGAMRDGSTVTMLSTEKDNASRACVGVESKVLPKLLNTLQNEKQILDVSHETKKLKGSKTLAQRDWTTQNWQSFTEFKKISVESVRACLQTSAPHILIMTTGQGEHAAYYAVGATTVSACLTTALEGLKRQSLICSPLLANVSETNESVAISVSGDRNWEKGLSCGRCFDSAMRHLQQYAEGDRAEDHLAAVAWNVFVIMFNEVSRPAMLDMPCHEALNEEKKRIMEHGNGAASEPT